MEFAKILAIAAIASLVVGQLLRIPPNASQGALNLTDILVLSVDFFFILTALAFKRSLKLKPAIFLPFLFFSLWAFATDIWALNFFDHKQVLISSFFLIRLMCYFFLAIVFANIVSKSKINSYLNLFLVVGLIFIIFGFAQLIFFPDFRPITVYGWDPHQKRIASTILDPNFSGFIFVSIFTTALSLLLFKKPKPERIQLFYWLLCLLTFAALILTFSRSSYLAFLTSMFVLGLVKSRKVLLLSLALSLLIFAFIPKVRSRVVGAFTVDETARARIQSWENGLTVFANNPALGVGFNTYRYAQAKYDFFSKDNPLGGHSGAGVDSSLLLVAATTGAIGFTFYSIFLIALFKTFFKKITKSPLNLAAASIFSGLLVHSLFVNSLFFPQIMLVLFFFLGLSITNDS